MRQREVEPVRGFFRALIAVAVTGLVSSTGVASAAMYMCCAQSFKPTYRVSLTDADQEATDNSGVGYGFWDSPDVSSTGRYVAFASAAALVPQDTNGKVDVYVRDMQAGTTTLVSVGLSGQAGNNQSMEPDISDDGRYVAFSSTATDLVFNGNFFGWNVYRRDLQTQTTEYVAAFDGCAFSARISGDGRFVAFVTGASYGPSDANGGPDFYVKDMLQNNVFERITVPFGAQDVSGSYYGGDISLSYDGRFVAFATTTADLVPGDTLGERDVFLRDRLNATTVRVSVGAMGAEANGSSFRPSLSDDGSRIVFQSAATNLLNQADGNGTKSDIFLRDLAAATTTHVSVGLNNAWPNEVSIQPTISANGSRVAFTSWATNLVSVNGFNGVGDVYFRDLATATTVRASVTSGGQEANHMSWYATIAAGGTSVVFVSVADNLVSGDTNNKSDVFRKTL